MKILFQNFRVSFNFGLETELVFVFWFRQNLCSKFNSESTFKNIPKAFQAFFPWFFLYLDVSENRGTPKSSMFNRVFPLNPSIRSGVKLPIFGNTYSVNDWFSRLGVPLEDVRMEDYNGGEHGSLRSAHQNLHTGKMVKLNPKAKEPFGCIKPCK